MNTIALQLRYRAPAPVRLKLAQANALRLSCEWADADTLPAAFDLIAEIHASRTVAPGSTPLAAQLVANLTSASADPWVIEFSGAQLNHPIPNPPTRRLWMVVYLRTLSAPVTVAAAELELEYHAISGITPAPPTPAIYLTPEAAADLFASIDDVDDLSDRVTSLEQMEGGGAQADWNAPSGSSAILNKPTLGNSSTRNVGTGAGDVAAGNHSHTTSQINGLDTALASKADLSDGKILVSQIPAIALSEFLGSVNSEAAMLALNGQRSDWCARTDVGKAYVLTAEPSSLLVNWMEWIYPVSPVISVAGRAGVVTLNIGDITGLGGVLDTKVNSDALLALAFRDTVGPAQIDAGAVTEGKIADGSVTAAKLAPGAVPPGGAGTELQCKNGTEFGAVPGSSVSGSVVTLGELRVNPADSAQGFRMTSAANVASLYFLGGNANGFIYAQGTASTASTSTAVAVRAGTFRVEGPGASDALAQLQVGSTARVIMRARALNNLALGPADAVFPTAPTPQTISVQNATGPNAPASAAVLTIDCAQGTGTGVGGDGCVRVSPPGGVGGSTPNSLVEVMRWRAVDLVTQCAGAIIAGGPVVYKSFTTITLPSVTLWTRGQIWVAGEAGAHGFPAFSDGTNWRRTADNSIISSSPS